MPVRSPASRRKREARMPACACAAAFPARRRGLRIPRRHSPGAPSAHLAQVAAWLLYNYMAYAMAFNARGTVDPSVEHICRCRIRHTILREERRCGWP